MAESVYGGDIQSIRTDHCSPTNHWPEAPLGGGGAWEGGSGRADGGSRRGFWGGVGGSKWGDMGVTCPQGQALVNHRVPLPPLARPLPSP